MKTKTTDLEKALKHASKDDLGEIYHKIHSPTFPGAVANLLTQKNITRSELIKNTNLDRTYAYQILSGDKNGTKDKILQICIALSCSVEETNQLLTISNNAKLYAKVKRDSLIIFALNNDYSVLQTNELLLKYNQEPLQ